MQTYTHTDHKGTHQHHLTVLTPDKKTNCPLVICCYRSNCCLIR